MATITSTAAGNWSAGGTWVGGVVPGNSDDAVVVHVVVFDAADQCKSILIKTDGKLTLNADLTFTDTAGCGLTIEDDGNFDNNGTAASPRTITSASGDSPAVKWQIDVEDMVGADTRTLDFDYVEFVGSDTYLGNDNNHIHFNSILTATPVMGSVTAPASMPSIVEHDIEGRATGRVYRSGAKARVMTISGVCRLDSFIPLQLNDMDAAKKRISLFTRFHHLPRCRLEPPVFGKSFGIYLPFSITVREDV